MKKIFLIGLLLSVFVTVNAQTDYSELARQQAELGNYEEAIRLESENLKLIEKTQGINNIDYIISLYVLSFFNGNLGNYEEAIDLGLEAMKIWENNKGKYNSFYAAGLSKISTYYSYLGNYNEAIRLGKDVSQIYEEIKGKYNPDYIETLNNLAVYNASKEDYHEAIAIESEVLKIRREIIGKNHPDYAFTLNHLAYFNACLGEYQEAIQLGMEALEIFEKVLGKNHPDYAISLDNLAGYYSDLGNYREAIRLGTEALNIFEEVLGKNHPHYAVSLDRLAGYNSDLGNYREAIRLGTEALDASKEVLGMTHPDYAKFLSNLALYNSNLGNYQEAIQLETEALNIFEEILGKNHPHYAVSLDRLAGYNSNLGNFNEALRLGTESLNITEKVLGKDHPDYAVSLSNLAKYYSDLGNYQEAIRLETEVLNILGITVGKDHPDYAVLLNNLASYYFVLGNYNEALRLGTEALNIREEILGKIHPDYAASLSILAGTYAELGNYREAIMLETKALNIFEEVLGKNHPDYATSLSNLACYNSDLGHYQKAICLGTEALDIRKEFLGINHPEYAASLHNLAVFNAEFGHYQEAIRRVMEALNILEITVGKDHPNYSASLGILANYNSYLGNFQEAIFIQTEALNITEKVLGTNHPDYANDLGNLSHYYFLNKDLINFKQIVWKYYLFEQNLLFDSFSFLPFSERNSFWNANNYLFIKWFPEFAYTCPDVELIDLGYNSALLSKGILLNSEIEFDKFLTENGTPELAAKFNEVKGIRMHLNKLYEVPIAQRWCDTDSLERVANNLERELMYESKEFGDYTRNLSISWQDVQKGLKDKDVAIEFVSFKLNEDSTMYMAYVLKPGMEAPELVKLFEEKDLKSKRIYSSTDPERIYDQKAASELIWRKFEPYLEGCENVYFAPDGLLHQIAIEYLPALDGEGMISDRYNIYRLSSTRQLAMEHGDRKIEKAVLYGGIEFDSAVAKMEEENRHYENELMAQNSVHRGYFGDNLVEDFNLRDRVSYLPGTATEVEEIQKIFNKKHKKTELYTGDRASEASFKSLSGKPNQILHLATHGFYWNENEADRMALNNNRLIFMSSFGENGSRYVEDKALTRSGLLMAGANNILRKDSVPDNIDDGILTAREISMLNLRDVDLVVLSACQTGLGDIGSDGVFGLQRGFKKAGANSLLMSLWKVDDDATRILMTEFYKNYLSGKSKRESLLAAQRVLQNDPKYYQPQYWAAFILLDGMN